MRPPEAPHFHTVSPMLSMRRLHLTQSASRLIDKGVQKDLPVSRRMCLCCGEADVHKTACWPSEANIIANEANIRANEASEANIGANNKHTCKRSTNHAKQMPRNFHDRPKHLTGTLSVNRSHPFSLSASGALTISMYRHSSVICSVPLCQGPTK